MPTRSILSSISRRAILAAGVGLIAVLLGATAVVLLVLRAEALQRAEWHLENIAIAVGEQTQQSVHTVDLVLGAAVDDIRRWLSEGKPSAGAALSERFGAHAAALPQLRSLAFIGADGRIAVHAGDEPAAAFDYSDRGYFRIHREGRDPGLHIGAPIMGRLAPEWTFTLSRRVDGPGGEFAGVAATAARLAHFLELYRSLRLGEHGRIFMFRADGLLLATHPLVEDAIGRSFAGDALLQQASAPTASGVRRRTGFVDDRQRMIAYQRLRDYPLVIAVSFTEDFILSEWRRDAQRVGAGAAGVTAFVALALGLLLRQHRVADELAREVRGSEERWRAAMEAAGHGVWEWDVPSGRVYRSSHYLEILGYSEHEIPAGREGWLYLLHPDDRMLSHRANRACIEGRTESFSTELRLRCRDGSWKWILNRGMASARDGEGRALRILGTITDLTEHRLAQQQLQESEARLNAIIRAAMDAIITVDEEQKIVLFNAAAERVFRCPAAEAIGAPLERFIPERFRAAHRLHVERFGATGVTTRMMGAKVALWGLRADGEEFPIDASISQITSDGKKLYTVILRDITERKRAEEALERSYEELRELSGAMHEVREAERMRVARELHDELAQWLTALRMDVAWLSSRLPPGHPHLADRAEKMKGLVDQTVSAVRRIAADLRPVMLDDLGLAAATENLVHEFSRRSGVLVSLDVDAENLDFEDPLATALYRITQEALTNVARHAGATEVRVEMRVGDGRLELRVRDNGRGIDPQALRRPGSYGLLGIRERALTLGGSARIERLAKGGTMVEIVVPLARYRRREAAGDQGAAG